MLNVTVKDVAALAGVSTATVSRVLSKSGSSVREETRQRVLQAASQLGYQPSSLPQTMRRRRSRVFGMVVGDIENPFFTAAIRGCEREADELGYRLVLVNTDEDEEREEMALKALAYDRVAGVVLGSTGRPNRGVSALQSVGTPVVAIDNRLPNALVDLVTVDNTDASRTATEHLLQLRHRRIVMISGPPEASSVAERELGFTLAVSADPEVADTCQIVRGDLREETAFKTALTILQTSQRPTAVFTVNNMLTMGLLLAVREMGLKIPSELSIVGFDDIPLGSVLEPPLTCVIQPTEAIGRRAARLLALRLDDPDGAPKHEVLATTFVTRGSTARFGGTEGDIRSERAHREKTGESIQ